jgi:hypothetical protein
MKTNTPLSWFTSKTTVCLCSLIFLAVCSCQKEVPIPKDEEEPIEEIPYSTILTVGRDKDFKTIKEASEKAVDSTLIEIDAGTYSGYVALWTQNNLILRAKGDVILDANGKSTGGKGIWEINGGRVSVEGITFKNARVPDRNGAGIRLTKGDLTVVNCRFLNNEMGLLTSNDGISTLTVYNSEFGYSGYGDGYSHNLYVGIIASLSVTGCYFHHANIGHLLKSRAALNIIMYNRLTDENDNVSLASYELDFPCGGQAIVVGNIIQQSKNTDNPNIIAYAMEESNRYPDNELYVCYNTVVNSRTQTDNFINAPAVPIRIVVMNNLLPENVSFLPQLSLFADKGNLTFQPSDLNNDYSPVQKAFDQWQNRLEPAVDETLSTSLKTKGIHLTPTKEYVHPANIKELKNPPKIPGAIQTPK